MTRKSILEVAVLLSLSALAISGWVRRPQPANADNGSPRNPDFAMESGAYSSAESCGVSVDDNGSRDLTRTNSETRNNRPQGGANPCAVSAKAAVYNSAYYTGPYFSSNRPVRVSTVALPAEESHTSAQAPAPTLHSGRTARRGRAVKHSRPVVWRSVAGSSANGEMASSATAAFVYDRLSSKTGSGF
jgi:hypothetical protein